VVAGSNVGRSLEWDLGEPVVTLEPAPATAGLVTPEARTAVRVALSRSVGVLRSADSLGAAAARIDEVCAGSGAGQPSQAAFEATNIATVARVIVAAAQTRTESRGCHRRTDFPHPDEGW